MPKVSEAHREDRRRQILEGARRAFAEHGYPGTTVPALEREIGLSRGAIFSYFPSKLELFVALAQADRERLGALWLEEGHEGVVRRIAEDPEWLAPYLEASRMLRTDPELRERWESMNPELERRLEERYTKLQEAGLVRSDLPLETTGRFLGLVLDGLALQQAARVGAPVDVEGTLELLRSALAPK